MARSHRRQGTAARGKKRPADAKPRTPEVPAADELAGPPPERAQCVATTARGTQCKRLAVEGGDRCSVHLGAPVGRTTKLDDDAVERIVQILRTGGYVEAAAAAAGISKQTFYNWLERGDPDGTEEENEPFREFRRKIERARAEGEARNVALIAKAAAEDWRAAAWMLERQYPDRWGGPRSRRLDGPPHPTGGENSRGQQVIDDQVGPDGQPL